jgi:perosamine synthetase
MQVISRHWRSSDLSNQSRQLKDDQTMERIGELERRYVLEVLDSQFRTSAGGSMTRRLEEKFAEAFDCQYAISFVNGTATMHAALAAAGVGPGDEVIVPPLTMASTSFAVLHSGALPVFADIDPLTWTIDPNSVEPLIGPRTKAIIPVSIYGLAPDLDSIWQLARTHDLFVLEDDAQCFLGRYKGRVVGSGSGAASFSFQSSKHMTSGEGGMITTNDADLATRIRRFNSLGYAGVDASKGKITRQTIQDPTYERHVSVGYNYRLSELCAAVALGQLERLEELVAMRGRVAAMYQDALHECKWLVPQAVPAATCHSYWTFAAKLDAVDFTWQAFRDKCVEFGGDGIYAAWRLTYLEPAFRGFSLSDRQRQRFETGLCPVAESIQPFLLQFKTNYMDEDVAARKIGAINCAIRYFWRDH